MNIQLIAFDLDGTLLNSRGQILTSSKKVIKKAIDQGIKVVLVTGRHHTATYPYHHELDLDTPIVACNGTYLYDTKTNTMPIGNPLSVEQAEQVICLAEEYQLDLLMYSRYAMNYIRLNDHMKNFSTWVAGCPDEVKPNLRQCSDFRQLLKDEQEVIWKFVISHPNKDYMQKAIDQLPISDFSCEWSWVDRVDVARQGNSKGSRLLELLKNWNIDPQNVIAFGDNQNDISMLSAVGMGVAMGNAELEVKAKTKFSTKSNDNDGIAEFLNHYL